MLFIPIFKSPNSPKAFASVKKPLRQSMRKIQTIIILLFPFSWKGYKLVKSQFKKSRNHSKQMFAVFIANVSVWSFQVSSFSPLPCSYIWPQRTVTKHHISSRGLYTECADTDITCCPRRRFSFWRRHTDSFWREPTWRWYSCWPIEQLSLNKCLRVFMLITAWYESPEIKRNEWQWVWFYKPVCFMK